MPIFLENVKSKQMHVRLSKFGLFVEENVKNSLNRMKIYITVKPGGLIR